MKTLIVAILLLSSASLMTDHTAEETVTASSDHANIVKALPLIVGPGNVIAVRELQLKPGVDPEEFERFAVEEFTPTFQEQVPGVSAYILKGERGDKKGRYSFALIFDSVNTRDYYYPFEHGGEASVPEHAEALWLPARKAIYEQLIKYVEDIGQQGGYTDYVVLGSLASARN